MLSVAEDLSVQVKAPLRMPLRDIDAFVENHKDWIDRQRVRCANRQVKLLSPEQTEQLRAQAKVILPQRVCYYSSIMNVEPAGVKITSAGRRWGSCSSRNSLCFPYRIMLLPPELIDYIVVHELAHVRVKNHSHDFYDEVAKYMPDYKARISALKKIELDI